jgi:tetratricopeptide (TPR) repeat protein
MKRFLRITTLLAATAALSGCASIFSQLGFAERASPDVAAPAQADGNVELAAARQAMDAGMTAEAIDHYRAAQMDPNALPAASNGLGVAYARLGRLDLADRYFRIATALDPSNARFAANMLRLQGDYALAQDRQAETTQLAATAAPAPAPQLAAAERPGELERVSRGEVHIRTAALQAAAPIAVVASRDAPPVAAVASLAGHDGPAVSYPVRIDLAKAAPSARRTAAAAAYPQRIELAKVVVSD